MISPPPLPTPAPPSADLAARSRSVQLALAFLLGAAVALLGVKLLQGRFTRPLDPAPYAFRMDVNNASINELTQLPRIGPALAERLVDARPFESPEDLRRVPGLGPATFDKIKAHVAVGRDAGYTGAKSSKPAVTEPINPNFATLEELQSLPGIGVKMSQRIVDARAKKPFASVEDMRRVSGIGPKTIEKLRSRLTFAPLAPKALD